MNVSTVFGLGLAYVFVLMFTIHLNWLLDQYILKEVALTWLGEEYAGYDLSFLTYILFIATIATMVQLVEIEVEKFAQDLYNSIGIFLLINALNYVIF